ncbi:hypothetical protein AB4Z52_06985 [Rhizobium sp. 2YAF20]|uniref:hypothetical protein n=1 Tax=Rhizobium sp. 2YAF20 TaxID=3233027 RepID=UPI003F98D820
MTERSIQKPTGQVERAVAVSAKSKPSVRLNGKEFEYAAESFNPKTMAKVLSDRIAKREVVND